MADVTGLKTFWCPEHRAAWWDPEKSGYWVVWFFFPDWKSNATTSFTSSPATETRLFLADWNKYKVHVCCIYLLLQRWVVPLEMLTGNKVHSFLSGRRMFPPQSREHLFGYLLGEAWHLQRDCNTVKPKEDGGEDVGLHQEPAGTPLPGWRGPRRARPPERCRGCFPPAVPCRLTPIPHVAPTNRNQSWFATSLHGTSFHKSVLTLGHHPNPSAVAPHSPSSAKFSLRLAKNM